MAPKKIYTEEQKAEALRLVPELGIHGAAKEVGIPWQTVTGWAAAAGVKKAAQGAGEAITAVTEGIRNDDAVVAVEIEVKKTARKAGRKAKEIVEDAKQAVTKPATKIIIQSPMGGEISIEEIKAKVPEGAEVYVRVDQNKLWWTTDTEKGDADIW